jgi:hypothetical protein
MYARIAPESAFSVSFLKIALMFSSCRFLTMCSELSRAVTLAAPFLTPCSSLILKVNKTLPAALCKGKEFVIRSNVNLLFFCRTAGNHPNPGATVPNIIEV